MITSIYITGNVLVVLGVALFFGIPGALIAAGGLIVAHARWKGSR